MTRSFPSRTICPSPLRPASAATNVRREPFRARSREMKRTPVSRPLPVHGSPNQSDRTSSTMSQPHGKKQAPALERALAHTFPQFRNLARRAMPRQSRYESAAKTGASPWTTRRPRAGYQRQRAEISSSSSETDAPTLPLMLANSTALQTRIGTVTSKPSR